MNVLVLATNDRLAFNVIRCLPERGARAHLLSPRLARATRSRFCASWTRMDGELLERPDDLARDIRRLCHLRRIDVVMASDLEAIRSLSGIGRQLEGIRLFPMSEPALLDALHDKWSFGRFLEAQQLPTPRTHLIATMDELAQLPLAYPVMVKPLRMEDSRGVRRLESPAEARAHVAGRQPEQRLPLLFQEYIPGTDVDLSLLATGGNVVAWTMQRWLDKGCLEFFEDAATLEIGRKIVAATDFSGVAHFDMRRDQRDGQMKVLECNPRFWATLRESMWNGTNFVTLGLCLAQEKALPACCNRRITCMFPAAALGALARRDRSALRFLSLSSLRNAWQSLSDPGASFWRLRERKTG